MYNEPSRKQLSRIPALYSSEDVKLKDKIIHMHFFIGGCDWYIVEYDSTERLFFGYAILGDDFQNAEWGYISFDELRGVKTRQGFEIDRDTYWNPERASNIEQIWKR